MKVLFVTDHLYKIQGSELYEYAKFYLSRGDSVTVATLEKCPDYDNVMNRLFRDIGIEIQDLSKLTPSTHYDLTYQQYHTTSKPTLVGIRKDLGEGVVIVCHKQVIKRN